jgi:hypothetical protein
MLARPATRRSTVCSSPRLQVSFRASSPRPSPPAARISVESRQGGEGGRHGWQVEEVFVLVFNNQVVRGEDLDSRPVTGELAAC